MKEQINLLIAELRKEDNVTTLKLESGSCSPYLKHVLNIERKISRGITARMQELVETT